MPSPKRKPDFLYSFFLSLSQLCHYCLFMLLPLSDFIHGESPLNVISNMKTPVPGRKEDSNCKFDYLLYPPLKTSVKRTRCNILNWCPRTKGCLLKLCIKNKQKRERAMQNALYEDQRPQLAGYSGLSSAFSKTAFNRK